MPNTQGIRTDLWENYLTTVDAVEALTGYNLFSELPQAIQACVEAGINGNNPALDQTPPAISCSAPDGVWHAANVSLACTASDAGGSGLVNPGDAAFSLSTSVPAGVETASASTGSRTVCDVAGNCATAGPIAGNMVDRKAPVITITAPVAQTYVVGQSVTATYICNDLGSGANTCAGPVASGQAIATSAPGAGVFTVTASDAAGNAVSQTVSYSVGFNVCALYDQTKAHKAGSTVPIKLQVCNFNGASVSSPAISVVATGIVQVANNAPGVLEDSGNANPDNQFRFTGDAYVFNLSTKNLAQGTYAIIFTVGGDATPHMLQFQVR
jgi:hypothetical protein